MLVGRRLHEALVRDDCQAPSHTMASGLFWSAIDGLCLQRKWESEAEMKRPRCLAPQPADSAQPLLTSPPKKIQAALVDRRRVSQFPSLSFIYHCFRLSLPRRLVFAFSRLVPLAAELPRCVWPVKRHYHLKPLLLLRIVASLIVDADLQQLINWPCVCVQCFTSLSFPQLRFQLCHRSSIAFRKSFSAPLPPHTTLSPLLYPKKSPRKNYDKMGGQVSKVMGKIFGTKEMRILMLGLDAAGKTSASSASPQTR